MVCSASGAPWVAETLAGIALGRTDPDESSLLERRPPSGDMRRCGLTRGGGFRPVHPMPSRTAFGPLQKLTKRQLAGR